MSCIGDNIHIPLPPDETIRSLLKTKPTKDTGHVLARSTVGESVEEVTKKRG